MDENTTKKKNSRPRRSNPLGRFLRNYFPSLLLALIVIFSAAAVLYTVRTVCTAFSHSAQPPQIQEPDTHTPVDPSVTVPDYSQLLSEAESLASGYDYAAAISLLQSVPNYESESVLSEQIRRYTQMDKELVTFTDSDNITHLFFQTLIADPQRAFDGDDFSDRYNRFMVTIPEFEKILESLYARGYILVSPYDIAYEATDASGNTIFTYGKIRIPEGKKPFLLSQDDVNYYGQMIGGASGVDDTPVFANAQGNGFASRIVIDENGHPTCEYVDASGNKTTGDYDLVPILERFIAQHPDFSYHGARGILSVTGYEGVFGYRTKPGYEFTLGTEAYQKEVEEAKKVAQCLKDHGWLIASHTYGHPSYGNIDADRVAADSAKWEETVQPIVGDTDILMFPYGADIAGIEKYSDKNEKFTALYQDGYRYFFNVDSKPAWCQIGDNYFRASRRNIDGYRLYHKADRLEDLFVASEILDPARPTPVPKLDGSGM